MSMICGDAWCSQKPCTKRLGDTRRDAIEAEVCDRLMRHNFFRGYLDSVTFEIIEDTLIFTGRLPSFYLKQILQTAMKNVPGVKRIENRVDVVSSRGLSSETIQA
ncbi:MAG: BON domain-containing protein [Bythopirellula sp.]|nr:BON domain-containing protein [Bythopirellula sp.]